MATQGAKYNKADTILTYHNYNRNGLKLTFNIHPDFSFTKLFIVNKFKKYMA